MGTGKSTIGPLVALRLGLAFRDMDLEIAAEQGMSVPEIFERHGESAFRDMETKWLDNFAPGGAVIAVGGGAPCQGTNMETILRLGYVVHLAATPKTILGRVQPVQTRPMLSGSAEPLSRIERLLQERLPYYRQANTEISVEEGMPEDVAERIVQGYRNWLNE